MTVSPVTSANLSTLIREQGSRYFGVGINQAAPLIGSGLLKKKKCSGEEWTETIFPSASSGTGFVLDRGYLPVGTSGLQAKARYMPTFAVANIDMGRGASKLNLSVEQVTSQLDAEMKERAADVGRNINRGLLAGGVSPNAAVAWSGTAADSTVVLDFLDVSMFRPGMAVDFIDTSAVLAYVVRVLRVTPATVGSNTANVAGTVTFINDVVNPASGAVVAVGGPTITVATNDVFRLRGATAGFGAASTLQGAVPNSFDDMAGSGAAASFAGIDPTTAANGPYNWIGHSFAIAAAYSQEAMLGFAMRLAAQSGVSPDVCVMAPLVAAAHAASGDYHGAFSGVSAAISAGRPKSLSTTDKYGNVYEDSGLRVVGAKVMIDPNCPATSAVLFNSEFTKLGVWSEVGPEEEAGDAVLLDRTRFASGVQFSGAYQLGTSKRSSVGVMSGITGL